MEKSHTLPLVLLHSPVSVTSPSSAQSMQLLPWPVASWRPLPQTEHRTRVTLEGWPSGAHGGAGSAWPRHSASFQRLPRGGFMLWAGGGNTGHKGPTRDSGNKLHPCGKCLHTPHVHLWRSSGLAGKQHKTTAPASRSQLWNSIPHTSHQHLWQGSPSAAPEGLEMGQEVRALKLRQPDYLKPLESTPCVSENR